MFKTLLARQALYNAGARISLLPGRHIDICPFCQERERSTLPTISLATHLFLAPDLFVCQRTTHPLHYLIVFHAKTRERKWAAAFTAAEYS